MKLFFVILITSIFILAACSPAVTNTPADEPGTESATQRSDGLMPSPVNSNQERGNVYLNSTELLTMESYPLQFSLVLKGNLPTPCNKLKISVNPPDAQNKIVMDLYSTINQDMVCIQALQPFEENFPLGSFPTGHYTLWINGIQAVEFDA